MKIKKTLLMSPGKWNNLLYEKKEVEAAFKRTNWKDPSTRQVFLDFKDLDLDAWVGYIEDVCMEQGNLYGNLIIADWFEGRIDDMHSARLRFGISPKIKGEEDKVKLKDFTFENFALVLHPVDKKTCFSTKTLEEGITFG